MGWFDEHGDPTDRLVQDWAIHDDHADGVDPGDGELDELGQAVLSVLTDVDTALAPVRTAAEQVAADPHNHTAALELAGRVRDFDNALRNLIRQAGEE